MNIINFAWIGAAVLVQCKVMIGYINMKYYTVARISKIGNGSMQITNAYILYGAADDACGLPK